MSLLALANITASYGASRALFGVNLTLEAGDVVALMRRNGMGKSTTVKVICRLLRHTGGQAQFAGSDLARLAPHQAARRGIGLVPEGRRCFPNLTVDENLFAATRPGPWDQSRIEALFPRLAERRGQMAVALSGGEQQMLAFGRALMTNPRLLILDEATEDLAPVVRQKIWAAIVGLKGQGGMSILLVDKSLRELAQVADRAVILERGRDVWMGCFDMLSAGVADAILGV